MAAGRLGTWAGGRQPFDENLQTINLMPLMSAIPVAIAPFNPHGLQTRVQLPGSLDWRDASQDVGYL